MGTFANSEDAIETTPNMAFHQCISSGSALFAKTNGSSEKGIQYHSEIVTCEIMKNYPACKEFNVKHASRSECIIENCFSYHSTKAYVVGTQKNCLSEAVLLSTKNTC